MASDAETQNFLDQALLPIACDETRPHVTLTFAQSVDGKIAGVGGKQLILSGKDSMVMTHRLRSRHDAILVGIGTALNDNPQLNTRLLAVGDGGKNIPLPIILDAKLRFKPESKLCANFKAGTGRRPTIYTSQASSNDSDWVNKKRVLEEIGVGVVPIPSEAGVLSLYFLLSSLRDKGIRTLMVEGGAQVISSFLHIGFVDSLIITVAPTIVGEEGIGYVIKEKASSLVHIQSLQVGRDTVMAWRSKSL